MILHKVQVGSLATNCYIIACKDTKEAVVIDPGDEAEKILSVITKENLKVKYIINTHGHWDHIGADRPLKEHTNADLLIHEEDAEALQEGSKNLSMYMGESAQAPKADKLLREGDIIKFGNKMELKVLHTPGHTPGSICLVGQEILFSGDTVFAGSIGRTDLPGGSYNTIMESIQQKIMPLEDTFTVYPGHGPQTSMKEEKESNPYFKA
ncbi:MAG: hydroxyacylglutathione hydrolase [Clostridia bacterium]|jgi:glyoxylase-like metal-dependent hydrolase (beta-lactamase superfamily II)|nr:beta-lactamase-like protein [Clostridiales bacterium]MDK2986590.1 hydroxyacylglutathione hydrolase [Clostridia bacterium]